MIWEYKIINVDDTPKLNETIQFQEELNNYKNEGWKVVSFFYPPQLSHGNISNLSIYSVIFKRQLGNIT